MSKILDYLIWHLKARKWVSALGDADGDVRKAAAKALGQCGNARAVKPLITVLRDENSGVRRIVAEALGELGDIRAVEPLIAVLRDENDGVRKAAADALDRLHWKPEKSAAGATYWIARQNWDQCVALGTLAIEPLTVALENADVREAATEALVQIGTSGVELLITVLENDNSDVRRTAADALGQLGDARAVGPLIATLWDKDSQVRSTTAAALDKLKWKPQTVEQEVGYWIAKEEWYKCADIGEPAIEPLLGLISLTPSIMPPLGAGDSIRHVLAERFGSYPSVIEALRKPRVILLADDERDIRELLGFTLRSAGFDVVLAADGIEAMEKVSLEQPDLILLDIRMPKITGYEVCRRLKKNPTTCAIPVVFLSAKGQEAEVKYGLDSGAAEYIVKPFTPDELTDQVKGILRRLEMGIYEED
jgi:HEAT repeat protein